MIDDEGYCTNCGTKPCECIIEEKPNNPTSDGAMTVAAQAYQVIRTLILDTAHTTPEHERALDYFSAIANGDRKPEDGFLPWG